MIYSRENGGRVLMLFLLFFLALYEFYTLGIIGMALICTIPFLILGIYLVFKFRMPFFWILFVLNYIIMGVFRYVSIPLPVTAFTIFPQILLLITCVIDIRENNDARYGNIMLFSLSLWGFYIVMQIFNRTCLLPISMSTWMMNFMFYVITLYLAFFIVTMMIRTPEKIMLFIRIWAYLTLVATFWVWRQKTFGWDNAENSWLMGGGARTHLIGGSIRYFSFFSDAANFGCSMGASAVAFYVFGITTKLRKDKILFLITGFCATYSFFMSGTRSGLLCFLVGIAFYIIISKSFKIAIPVSILGGLFFIILAFTQIGESNMQIRRMRSAFNPEDKSANVRDINKAALAKYLKDAPFGMGFNVDEGKVPANHKYKVVYETSNDSTYVFLWQRVGIVGATLFGIINALILLGGCSIVLTVLKNKACIGIAAGFCCSFIAIHAGGYTNHILLQYPNILLYYGGMAIVYLLPEIEKLYEKYEEKRFAEQEERKRLKLEKKLASRV